MKTMVPVWSRLLLIHMHSLRTGRTRSILNREFVAQDQLM